MLELLSPAGSQEAVSAAVQNGADAIYLGYGDFNARRNAKNFSQEEFAAAVSYCHLRGVKVYLTLNTLVTDRELPAACAVAQQADALGVDAVLVQDLGLLRLLRCAAPDLPLHASTQMSVHNLDGVQRAADLGMTRAVLARELPRDQIAHICAHAPIEIEVFAHGALCMCYSGQCFLSSVLGGRSGNRGLCAQPCRMQYGWGKRADGYPLSLKDMSLAGHLKELDAMGVACVKLEGRMKRPEYVAIVTGIYAAALREQREPTADELAQLAAAFSRQGFTDGYYQDQKGPAMFGVREQTQEPKALFAQARATYATDARRLFPVRFSAQLCAGEPMRISVQDDAGHTAAAVGDLPAPARTRALTQEQVAEQLAKTGGTPYRCTAVDATVEDGLSLPLSALNALRRQVLDDLTEQRTRPPVRRVGHCPPAPQGGNRPAAPVLTLSVRRAEQVTQALLALAPALLYLPLDVLVAHPALATARAGTRIGVMLPRIAWDRERAELLRQLQIARDLGVQDALVGNLGMIAPAQALGFTLRGDYGLEIYNSHALEVLHALGFASATGSFELKRAQLRDLVKPIDLELITYGRLPLMITENCVIQNRAGRCACQAENTLCDRKGMRFPVLPAPGCRNELFNAQTLFLADKSADFQSIGLWAQRLMFTTEDARRCVQVTERYLDRNAWTPDDLTRGLYYRDVE